ncbi:hypothetical protein DZF91_02170 [Actinomadura logoneensis]|uniref:Uncharacterized protein n=1 Tax=Actinomadura logoneensis TaxID=2293572 RepID=A0A372JTC6_9ACTN|nr:TOMM precursor leader peptide-binding protein [Actinomadura logoneensis]RFU43273.1 hypothetical protein DZF91_02170 [Actinomadura logoneensis]
MTHPRLKRHLTLVAHGPDVVELRHGVLSPSSVTLTDDTRSGRLLRILAGLDGCRSVAEIAASQDLPEDDVAAVVARLTELDLLEHGSGHALDHYLDRLVPGLAAQEMPPPEAVTLLGDPGVCEGIARVLGDEPDIRTADDRLRAALREIARSEPLDGLDFEEAAEPFAPLRDGFAVFAVDAVDPLEFRAFNRVCLHHRVPWIHAASDGPLLLVGPTFVPYRTSCYGCLETRLMANMRDSAGYQRYKNALAEGRVTTPDTPLDATLSAMLTSLTSFEALNLLRTGTSFTAGKMLTLYLPTMEFAFHEVLRSPSCPDCAPAPEQDDTALYYDIRALLNDADGPA